MSESSSLKEGPLDIVKEKYQTAKRAVSEKSMQSLDNMYSNVLTSPATVVILLIIISAFFAQQGMDFQSQIDDDVEIFLPDGAPSTDLLLEVREEWSTDLTVIYIRTENAFDMSSDANITDKEILDVISWVEGDDNNVDGDSISRGIDYDKDDHGENDGVLWIISPAQVIKEINSADGRFNNSMCEHGVATRILLVDEEWCSNLPGGGEYAIPEQERIDTIIEQSNGSFDTLIKDTNNDGIWDTTAIIVGMNQNFEVIDDFNNFEELLAHFERVVDNRPESEITVMTVTGLTKVLEDISDAIYEDLLMILPWSILFTVLIITTLHRSLKVVAITGTPIVMALAFTFGSSVILDITLTPMIVATFPILIGLGVDYALHMVNRIEEVRRKELQRMQEENIRRKKRGEKELKVPDLWDMDFYKKCVLEMASSTGVAVFLSAVTTVIGFSVLIAPQIVTVAPIRSVGVTLVLGIASTLVFSIILVPTIAWMLRYNKRTNPTMWKNIGKFPVKAFLPIVIIFGSITFYGIVNLDSMNEPITGSSEAPDGIDSLNSLAEYSEYFSGGQTSLFIFSAEDRPNDNNTDRIRDLPVLDVIDGLEQRIGEVERTNTTSIITFLRACSSICPNLCRCKSILC